MDNKIEIFNQKFATIVNKYVDDYKGQQPIKTVDDTGYVKIEPEFLKHLPIDIKAAIEDLVRQINA